MYEGLGFGYSTAKLTGFGKRVKCFNRRKRTPTKRITNIEQVVMLHLQHPETMKIHKCLFNQHLISNVETPCQGVST